MSDLNQTFLETVNEEDEEVAGAEEEEQEGVALDTPSSGIVPGHTWSGDDPAKVVTPEATSGETRKSSPSEGSPPGEEPTHKMADSMDSGVESDYGKLTKSIEDPTSGESPVAEVTQGSRSIIGGGGGGIGGGSRRLELQVNNGIDRLIRLQDGRIISQRELIEIYTQWANHYLEKAGENRRISDLQLDLADGILLAAIVQSIGGEKVKGINPKPITTEEKIFNIQKSLDFLNRIGVKLENITARDIYVGRLQPILLLFYSLSRLKQHHSRRPSLDNKRSIPSYHHHQQQQQQQLQHRLRPSMAMDFRSQSPGNHLYLQSCHLVSNNNDDVTGIREPGRDLNRETDECWHQVIDHLGYNDSPHPSQCQHPGSAFAVVERRALKPPTGGATVQNCLKFDSTSSIPRPFSLNTRQPQECRVSDEGTALGNVDNEKISDKKSGARPAVKVDNRSTTPAACMLGKLKLFNSKDKSAIASPCETPPGLPPRLFDSSSARKGSLTASPEAPAVSRDLGRSSLPPDGSRKELPERRPTNKGLSQDPHGLATSNIPGPSGIPTMEDRKRLGSTAAAIGRAASASTSHPRPSALPSSRTSSSSSISSLSGAAGALGTPVTASAARSASKSASKSYSATGTRGSGQRQGTATAITPPSVVTGGKQAGKSAVPSSRARSAKSPSGASQPVGKSPSTTGIQQPIGRSPSSLVVGQAPPSGKMATVKQIDGKARSSDIDDLDRCRSAGSSGSRTALNSIPGPGGMRSALPPPQAGRRDGALGTGDPRRSGTPMQGLPGTDVCHDPRRLTASPDPRASKTSQKLDGNAPVRQGLVAPSNTRSPLTVLSQSGGSSKGRGSTAGTAPDFGFSSVSSFKPSSSPTVHLPPGNGVAKDTAPHLKPRKIDSDTQTNTSAMRRQGGSGQQLSPAAQYPSDHRQRSPQGSGLQSGIPKGRGVERRLGPDTKDQSSSSLNSDSTTASGLGDDSSKSGSGASNSNNSASSTDSVIYRPSSCDESDQCPDGSGTSSKGKDTAPPLPKPNSVPKAQPPTQFTDHISSLRNKRTEESQRLNHGDAKSGKRTGTESPKDPGGEREASPKDTGNGAGEEMLPFDVGIKPMQPIVRPSPYAYLRSLPVSLGRPSGGPYASSHSPGSSIVSSSRLGAHRPLLDPSNMYLSPGRSGIGGGLGSGRFLPRVPADAPSDTEGFDVTAGYMSDGDILRSSYLDDVNCGYMSEGGLTQYVKRIQQRFREGMLAVKECMEKSNALADDDSPDDGSSISSSEISDAINEVSTDENLTGSSLSGASSERNSYGSIRHGILGGTASGVSPYPSRSLPLSHRAYLQQMRSGGSACIGGQPRGLNPTGSRCGAQPDGCLGENWQKYTIREENRGGSIGGFSRGTLDRATLPVAARERGDPRGFGYSLGLPGGIYVKKSHQAVITDLKGRSLRGGAGSGTAVAVDDGSSHGGQGSSPSSQTQGPKQKRDSETNTDLSAMMMMQKHRPTGVPVPGYGSIRGGDPGLHQSGCVSDCEAAASRSSSRAGRQHGLGIGRGSLIPTDQGGHQQYPIGTSSLERRTAAAASTVRRNDPGDYSSSSLGRKYVDDPSRSGDSNHRPGEIPSRGAQPQGRILCRNGLGNDNYVNVDSLWADHGGLRPLSDGLGSPSNGLGGGGGGCGPRQLVMKSGRVLRTALSETDSVEDLYSPFGFRGHGSQTDAYGLGSRSLKHGDEMNRGYYSDYATSMSPGNTLHRAESLHMTSASGAHGSSLSLMSNSSSVYSTAEEKQAQEIRKLRRELEAAQEKVSTLTTQLSTNAHVVAAFEQSLSSMTQRLQQLTNTSHQKESELSDLKETIEALRLQSRTQVAISSGVGAGGGGGGSSGGSGVSGGGTFPRQSIDQTKDSTCSGHEPITINRHMSADSVTSLNSLSSATSQPSSAADLDKKKKKKNWLKNSFTKAFSRKKGKGQCSASDFDADSVSLKSDISIPNSPMLGVVHPMSTPTTPTRVVQLSTLMMKSDCASGSSSSRDEAVTQLKHELHEKDLKLTDIQLEALASAHQLEQLCDTMNRMKSEMSSLKADNDRLQRIIARRGLDTSAAVNGRSQTSLEDELSPESNHLGLAELPNSVTSSSVELTGRKEGKRVLVSVLLGSTSDIGALDSKPAEVLIGALLVSKSTKWEAFESTLRRAFKEYMTRIEPSNSMGLNTDSILMYRAGDAVRTKSSKCPEMSPFDCLKEPPETVSVTLKGTQENSVDCLSFETLIPKAIMQRYVSLLLEHRRIILCGPSGTGKTYLAQKLAEYVVSVSGKDLLAGLVATFNVDHKSSKELRQYLANIAEQCEHNAADLPSIIILDNLHHVGSLSEVFTGFLSVKHQQCPYIIGTMNQTTCSTTNLQLHHNFRWVLCANHMEPVKGFLGRYLRHKLVDEEVKTGVRNKEMNKIADWLPKVWQHLNKFLETHSSSDVTIGPRLFLACPMDVTNAQVWFTDLWNYSIVPYLLEAVREGIQTYGHRAPWEDPAEWVIETYPWNKVEMPTLLHLRTEDVGYDLQGGSLAPGKSQATSSDTENKDPLMNMLLRLQEAANYSSPPSNESDSTSLDSHESRVCGSTPKSPVPGDTKT